MRKRLWTTSEAATQIALEKSGREGRKEGGKEGRREGREGARPRMEDGEDESQRLCIIRSHTHSLFLSAPLQLPSQSTPTHFSSLTEALQPFDL